MAPVQFWLAMSLPKQYRPPCLGAGLLHSLLRNWRQSGLHEDQEDQDDHWPSTEGHMLLHVFFCTWGPSHPGPSLTGAGLLQARVRFLTPWPHFALQSDHSPQSLHCPGTANKTNKQIKNLFVKTLRSSCPFDFFLIFWCFQRQSGATAVAVSALQLFAYNSLQSFLYTPIKIKYLPISCNNIF